MTDEDLARDPQMRPLIYAALSRLCGRDMSRMCDVALESDTLIMTPDTRLTEASREDFVRVMHRLGAFARYEGPRRIWTISYRRLLEE